jgi:hypothetical protein
MSDIAILRAGAEMRAEMLNNYQHIGPTRGAELARQYFYEIGQAVKLVHGTKEAAAMLYSIADAVTLDLPIEDFRLPPAQHTPPAASATDTAVVPATSRPKRIIAWLNMRGDRFFVGFWAALIVQSLLEAWK